MSDKQVTFADAVRNISFGTESSVMSGRENTIGLNYSRDEDGKKPNFDKKTEEQQAVSYILKTLGVNCDGVLSGGGMKTDYALVYSDELTPEKQKEIKDKLSKLSDKEINELSREGANTAKKENALKNVADYSFNDELSTSYKKQALNATIELTKVDLPSRDGGGKTTQSELDDLASLAEKHGATLSINNVKGDKDSVTLTYADGKSITQAVTFSDDKIKLSTLERE
jgi:hypothetical protein